MEKNNGWSWTWGPFSQVIILLVFWAICVGGILYWMTDRLDRAKGEPCKCECVIDSVWEIEADGAHVSNITAGECPK